MNVVGTQITDALTDGLDVSLYLSTSVFAVALAATFAIWYAVERTLSIHTIVTTRRELFYWAAILFTFALGTAAGDLTTEAVQLGFQLGVIVFGALIAVVALAYFGGANPVLTFWIAYVLTRPLGASLGDLLSQAQTYGGIGLGTIVTSAVFLTVIIVLVASTCLRGSSAIGSDRRAGRGGCSIQAWRPLRFPHHRRRYCVPGRQRRPRGGEGPGQGPRDVLGRRRTRAEAARAGGVAYRRQGHRSRLGGVARE